jgi:hypothetical protein
MKITRVEKGGEESGLRIMACLEGVGHCWHWWEGELTIPIFEFNS